MLPIALSIAGSDPSGGAGIQADLKTFQAHGVYGTALPSLLTVQNTRGVSEVSLVSPALVAAQLDALLVDLPPRALKTGALGSAAQIDCIAALFAERVPTLVIDPVIASTSGASLLDDDGVRALCVQLIPLATLITPNLDEAARLTGRDCSDDAGVRDAAHALVELGARAVLIKGGHRDPGGREAVDLLWSEGAFHELRARRSARSLHGLGCALSAAITARLARGEALLPACEGAKAWLTRAIENAPDFGARRGPIDFAAPDIT